MQIGLWNQQAFGKCPIVGHDAHHRARRAMVAEVGATELAGSAGAIDLTDHPAAGEET